MTRGRGGNDNPNDGCFAEDSKVWVKMDGSIIEKQIGDVKVGDQIQSVDPKTGKVAFTKVCFIQHDDDPNPYKRVLTITFKNDTNEEAVLRITPNHLVYVSKVGNNKPFSHPTKDPICASKIEVGDYLWVKNGEEFSPCSVIAIFSEENVKIVNPITMNHHIVVNGVHASVHVDNEVLFKLITLSLRVFYSVRPAICTSRPLKAFNRLFYKKEKGQDRVLPLQNTELSA